MNSNNYTLANDIEGELLFFFSHMPERELDLSFKDWIDEKVKSLIEQFSKEAEEKLSSLKLQFDIATQSINSLDLNKEEDINNLIALARKFEVS